MLNTIKFLTLSATKKKLLPDNQDMNYVYVVMFENHKTAIFILLLPFRFFISFLTVSKS